ncbi:helix-hairpin-helix domain-containing protein [Streptomyces sp. NPDC005953]|uniref:helix-hairpin-helix domain-containing protein n=1 Tax=Streptomyces sp. NPDC005953 TaxID=3156719 RepID=UPI0034107A85
MTASSQGQGPGPHAEPASTDAPAAVSEAAPSDPAAATVTEGPTEAGTETGTEAGDPETVTEAADPGADESAPSEPTDTPETPETDTSATSTAETGAAETGATETGAAETGAAETDTPETGTASAETSEAAAELLAQQELRERIEQRKAEKEGPIASGTKLRGQAADLLAAVRAVESGESTGRAFFPSPAQARTPADDPSRTPSVRAPGSASSSTPAAAGRPSTPETVAAVRAVLGEGAPDGLAVQVADVLGDTAAARLKDDPWQLLAVPGVLPQQADGFARALLGDACGPGDERRTAALVVWQLERSALRGHTALESSALCAALAEHAVPEPEEALRSAAADGVVLLFDDSGDDFSEEGAPEDAETADETVAATPVLWGLDRYALAEESLADGLARLARAEGDDRWEAAPGELARALAASGLVVHTGAEAARAEPLALATAATGLGLRCVVAFHSGHGRGVEAGDTVTVAGLLSGAEGPGRDGDGALVLDLLVVLDAPLLDVETAAMLVESLPDGSRLLLSGDPGQLGSAGAGRVFADLLAARVCPTVASRTPDPGPLGELVSGIGAGELCAVAAPDKEVVIVPVRDAGEAVHRTVQLVADSVPRAIGVPTEQTQVITVGHGGAAGTRVLNAALKQRLNPGPGRFGGFDPGDRIAYAPAIGRTLPGTVVSADAEGLRLECGEARVTVPRERVDAVVRHGWAMTAHQAAGMRWPAAVVVLSKDAAPGLSRPWVYTAFGRASRHLSVVHGVDQALPHAVAQVPAQERTTRLRTLLEGLLRPERVDETAGA